MCNRKKSTVASLTSGKHLFFAALTLSMFCLTGINAAAQDKIPFGDNDTLEEIRAKIKHNGYKFTVEHNWVFELSPEERAKMFRPRRISKPGNNISVPNTDIILKSTKSSLPAALDWRNVDGHSYIGPLRNQGHTCACVTFACCDSASFSVNVKNGLYDQNCVSLSTMYMLWVLGPYYKYGLGGHNPDLPYYYSLMKTGGTDGAMGFEGACMESDFPFVDSYDPPSPDIIEKAKTFPRMTIKNWNRVYPANYADTTDQIKEAIAAYGGVSVSIKWCLAWQAYKSGVYEDTYTVPDKYPYYDSTLNHGVSLIGWDDNPPEGGGGCWILRNNYGAGWGDNGYMRIRYFSAEVNTSAAYAVAGDSGPYAIRGIVSGPASSQGTTMSLTGTDTSAVPTDAEGPYSLGDLVAGTYTVTPTCPGYSFEPPNREVTVPGEYIADCNFTSTETGPLLTIAVSPENKGIAYPSVGITPVQKDQWTYINARSADPCYIFNEWSIVGNAELKAHTSSDVNEVRLAGGATITAVFVYKGPPLTVNLKMLIQYGDSSGTVTPDADPKGHEVGYNIPINIDATPAAGRYFSKWTVDKGQATIKDIHQHETTVVLTGDAEILAWFGPVKKEVQLGMKASPADSGFTSPLIGTHTIPGGSNVEIEAIPADGYYFEKWTSSDYDYVRINNVFDFNTQAVVQSNVNIIANFKKMDKTASLTMAVSPENSGTTNPAAGAHTVPVGAHTEIEAVPADGYFFVNWTATGSAIIDELYNENTLVVLSGDATVTANFAKIVNTVTLTMAVDGPDFSESTTNPGVGDHVVPAGAWTNIEAVPAEDWFFVNWTIEGDAEIIDMFSMETAVSLNGNTTVTANFLPIITTATLTLAVTPENSGSTNPSTGAITVNVGEHIGIQAIPADGFFFDKWTAAGDADIRDPYDDTTSVVISDDDTVTANFAPILTTATLTLAVAPDNSGSTNPGVGTHAVPCGAHTQIEAVPASGYFFEKWTSAGGAVTVDAYNDKTSVVLSADATVTANFAQITNTATLTMSVYPSSYSGSVNPGIGNHTVAVGKNIQIEAVPSDGHYFERWTSSNENAVIQNPLDATTSVAASGDSTVTAVFSTNPDFDDMAFGKIYTLDIYYVMGLVDFAKTPRAYCQYISPVSQKPRHTSLKVAGRIKEKATTVDLEWDSRIALLPRKVWTADRKKTCEQILEANPPDPLTCSLFASGTDSEKNSVRKMGTGIDLMLNPPEIAGIYNQDGRKITSAAAGEAITVKGMYFGKAIPAIWLEYPDKSGKIKQLRLKVDRKSLIYLDYEGNPSCMDKDDGRSQFSTAIPKKLPRNWNYGIQHNLVINNRICRSTTKFQTGE